MKSYVRIVVEYPGFLLQVKLVGHYMYYRYKYPIVMFTFPIAFNDCNIVEYPVILASGLDVLDGTVTTEGLTEIATQCNTTMEEIADPGSKISSIMEEIEVSVKAAGGLIWEFVKSNSLSSLSPVLQQVGFDATLAEAFGKVGCSVL